MHTSYGNCTTGNNAVFENYKIKYRQNVLDESFVLDESSNNVQIWKKCLVLSKTYMYPENSNMYIPTTA